MKFNKILCISAGISAAMTSASALKGEEYSIRLTDDAQLKELEKQDNYRVMASEILRQHWNAHLAKVRLKHRNDGKTARGYKMEQ